MSVAPAPEDHAAAQGNIEKEERPANLSVCWPPSRECLAGLKSDHDNPERVSVLCYTMQCIIFTAVVTFIVAVVYTAMSGKRGK